MVLLAHLRNQHCLSLASYGRPRSTEELNELGLAVGQRRVGRLMRQNGGATVLRTRQVLPILGFGRIRKLRRAVRGQTHLAGRSVFDGVAGGMIDVIISAAGETQTMKLFVAAMTGSNYIFAERVSFKDLVDWTFPHVRMFALA